MILIYSVGFLSPAKDLPMPAMPQAAKIHVEHHFLGSETVRDVVIGMADGLTVPFALAAGLSAAVTSTHLIVTAGLAEIVAGAIAMGLGGYLAARTDQEHYGSEERRETFSPASAWRAARSTTSWRRWRRTARAGSIS